MQVFLTLSIRKSVSKQITIHGNNHLLEWKKHILKKYGVSFYMQCWQCLKVFFHKHEFYLLSPEKRFELEISWPNMFEPFLKKKPRPCINKTTVSKITNSFIKTQLLNVLNKVTSILFRRKKYELILFISSLILSPKFAILLQRIYTTLEKSKDEY